MNAEDLKLQSKKLKELSLKYGYEMKHSHILEILSKMNNDSNWHVSSKDKKQYIKTGLQKLDNNLKGGLKKGTVTIVTGEANIGKSMMCLSMTCNALREKKKVLVYELEGQLIEPRIIANLSNINVLDIINENLSKVQINKIKKIKKNIIDKYLTIKKYLNLNFLKIEDLKESVFEEKSKNNFEMIMIDYPQLIDTEKNNYQKSMDKIYEQLKKIALAYNCAVLVPFQVNRTATNYKNDNENFIVKLKNSHGSQNLIEYVDVVISLNRNNKERKNEDIRIYLEKNYSGEENILYKVKGNFQKSNLLP